MGCELTKMAYAEALGSKSVSLTLPGLIGWSLLGFFFFHMGTYYAPDRLKPTCTICKYTFGASFWIICTLTYSVLGVPKEQFFGEEVSIETTNTGGTILYELGDLLQLHELLEVMKQEWEDTTKKHIKI